MGAGLVLTQQTSGFTSSSVFHRFEYGDNLQPGIEGFTNGTPDPNYTAFDGKLVYLQLQKSGTAYTYSYSSDWCRKAAAFLLVCVGGRTDRT